MLFALRACIMEANTESLRELVQLYEINRVLWDSIHSDYYNKCKKEDAWRQISQQVNMNTVRGGLLAQLEHVSFGTHV